MVHTQEKVTSPAAYLQAERGRAEKHEYLNGQIIPMGGASFNHNRITRNLVVLLANILINKDFEVFSSDLRVHNPITQSYTYPDVVVVKGEIEYLDDAFDTLLNPLLIVEVSSDSTFERDLHEKFVAYRKCAGFQEYLLIAQDKVLIQKFYRIEGDHWEIEDFNDPAQTINCKSVQATLKVADVYKKVKLA